jgi:glycosyltransferase involved in cell wall biosynthesis
MNGKKTQGTLLFVGRIAPEKNLDALLEAIVPLDVRLVFIGEGKLRADLQGRFAALGDRVVWEGNVPNSEIPGYLNQADIFVLPSLYEGHPKVILEAMACAVPVVGADSPGIRELIEHGETGLLCNPDPIGIRNALQQLLTDPELCSRLGARGRHYVTQNYSLPSIAEIEADLLSELAERKLYEEVP